MEPFGGSGAVLLGKERKDKFEVFNDFDSNIVNFLRCARDRNPELLQALRVPPINSREEFERWRYYMNHAPVPPSLEKQLQAIRDLVPEQWCGELQESYIASIPDPEVRQAVNYFKLMKYSYTSRGRSFACQPTTLCNVLDLVEALEKRLDGVILENQDFEEVLRHYDSPETFTYLDPPYLDSEYVYDSGFGWEDHVRLRDSLKGCRGKWLLSYNDSPSVRELYQGYDFLAFTRPHPMRNRKVSRERSLGNSQSEAVFPEILIANYDLLEQEKNKPEQMTIEELIDGPRDLLPVMKERVLSCRKRKY